MKTRFLTVIGLAAALLVGVTVTVQAQFLYTISAGKVTITGYTGPGGDVIIPDTINGLPVTSIGLSAFSACASLTSVTIPDSVTSIGGWAFSECIGLTSVTMPNSLAGIGGGAFLACAGLTSLTIPDSVTSIGPWAFAGCSGLTSITIPHGVSSIGEYMFSGCSGLTSITIPDSVITIEYEAFSGCTGLTSVTIPDSVTSIGGLAFSGCTNLTSARVGNGVTSIDSAFSGCTSLRSVTVGRGVTRIENGAFEGCTSLIDITVDVSNPIYSSVDGALFDKVQSSLILCPQGKVGHFTIPDSVTSISERAFSGRTALTTVTIGNGVISIGRDAFSGCTGLTSIDVGIGNPNYSSLDGVLLNKSQTVLIRCPQGRVGSYTAPDSVTSIEERAFEGCTSLTSITMPDSVTSIGNEAFRGCTGLTSITIPDSVTSIGRWAFDECSSLVSIVIPDSVTSTLECIYACSNLTSVIVGRGIRSIGFHEFGYCPNLTSVYFSGPRPNLDSRVFDNSSNVTVYYLPETSGWSSTFGGRPTAVWKPQVLVGDGELGIRDGHLNFDIFWARDKVVVVEACADLANPDWVQVGTRTLTDNVTPFSDPDTASQPGRFYRLREQ